MLIALGVAIIVYMGFFMNMDAMARGRMQMASSASHGANPAGRFNSQHVGLAFDYPAGYAQALNHIHEDQPDEYHQVVFAPGATTTDASGINVEPSITILGIDVPSSTNLEAWVKSDQRSNFALSGGQMAATTVDGKHAVSFGYRAGGYGHDAVVAEYAGEMYVFDVSYKSASDPIRSDFEGMIKSMTFLDPENGY
jgi:predicted Zn-dependent protease